VYSSGFASQEIVSKELVGTKENPCSLISIFIFPYILFFEQQLGLHPWQWYYNKLGATVTVSSNRSTLRRNTRRNIPEDGIRLGEM
jgi:hypothetical protein